MRNSNITKNRIRVALLLVLAATIIGLAPAFSTGARAATTYSVFSVSGNYVDHANFWQFGDAALNPFPGDLVGLVTFTPATGTFHADWIIRAGGTNTQAHPNGTYTVDANGHGTMTWTGMTGAKQRDFYIVNGGAELKYIVTDPPATAQIASTFGTLTKQ
jgi:hypothetical protein